ncbi:MAG: phosphate regulon transcriptional regulator PhoB [Rhizobiaceae bacterium]
MNPFILVVEDEESISMLLQYNLEAEGYRVQVAATGDEAELAIAESLPDLIVLDWMLPGISGIELCRRLRQRAGTRHLPVIMLTARGEESERIRGLATGADDYVVKPFSVPELMARIKAMLRRANPSQVADRLEVGELSVDREVHRAYRGSRELKLGPTEFRLLEHFMRTPGRVFTREQLLDAVWGRDVYVDERTVDVHVGRLRKAINRGREADPIRTVRGSGYAFDDRFGGVPGRKAKR